MLLGTEFYIVWIAISLFIILCAAIALWTPRAFWQKITLLLIATFSAPVLLWLLSYTDGKPVVCDFAIKRAIIGFKLVQHEGIFLLLDGRPPIYCVTPYSRDMAAELVEKNQEAQEKGRNLMMFAGEGAPLITVEIPVFEVPEKN